MDLHRHQGILQGTYETFAECAPPFRGRLAGRLVVTAGLGGMGGAQPLAVTMNGGVCLAIEVDPARIPRRLETGYCDRMCTDPRRGAAPRRGCVPREAARFDRLLGNAADVLAAHRRVGCTPDVVTDQTSAHDRMSATFRPERRSGGGAVASARCGRLRGRRARFHGRARPSHADAPARGAVVFDYGNNIRGQVADRRGVADAFQIPGFVPAFVRPLFCRGSGPFRWVALSGDPADIAVTDRAILDVFPDDAALGRWIDHGSRRVTFQGLPARIFWLAYGERAEAGAKFNWLVRRGLVSAPIAIGRDHLDGGSVASPYPRDRGDEGWIGRDCRLAAAECAPQHGVRRELGRRSTTAAALVSATRFMPGW